ncbi:GTP 3',8-cyclase MoaA [Candidatus Latescibacterota bacterium]
MKYSERETSHISLRVSVTDRCQLNCLYCRPPEKDEKCFHQDLLTFNEILNFVNFLNRNYGLSKVHITGGEPLMRCGIVDFTEKISKAGITDIALTTNGQLLGEFAKDLKRAGLNRVNISLDSLDTDIFQRLTHSGKLIRTLAGIETAIDSGFDSIKLNTVVIRNRNDHEVMEIAEYGIAHHCHVRFLELMPFGLSAENFDDWFVSSDKIKNRLEETYEFRQLVGKSGGSSRDYMVRDSKGRTGIIGFISPISAPFCSGCRRLRLTSDGRLLGCLARKEGFEIRSLLHNENVSEEETLKKAVESALSVKHNSRSFNTRGTMAEIGG